MRSRTTPLGTLGRGLAAGAVGTVLMTAAQGPTAKLRGSGGAGDDDGGGDAPQDPWAGRSRHGVATAGALPALDRL